VRVGLNVDALRRSPYLPLYSPSNVPSQLHNEGPQPSAFSAPYIPSGTRKVTMSGRNRREVNEVLLNELCFSIMNPVIKSAGHFTRNKPSTFANTQQPPKGVTRILNFSTYHNTPSTQLPCDIAYVSPEINFDACAMLDSVSSPPLPSSRIPRA
jgi:hypothetical protein